MVSLRAPIDLTLSDLEWPKSRSFRYRLIEEQYSVNIYFIVVAFDVNLGAISCSLLAGGGFRCPSGLILFVIEMITDRRKHFECLARRAKCCELDA